MAKAYMPALDGLRALAVLAVIAQHFDGMFGVSNGAPGVDIFFVLSGFLITSLLVDEFKRAGTISLRNFYARRMLRLFPALIVAVVIFSLVALKIWPHAGLDIGRVAISVLLYIGNFVRAYGLWGMGQFGHTWSLAVEEQFYLLWPLAFLLSVRRWGTNGALTVALLLGVVTLAPRFLVPNPTEAWLGNSFETRAFAIFVGVCAALWMNKTKGDRKIMSRLVRTASIPAMFLIFMPMLVLGNYWMQQQFLVLAGTAVVVVSIATGGPSVLSTALSFSPLVYIGKISYGLYLFHYPIWLFARTIYPEATVEVRQVGCLILSFGMAALSFKFIESPILNFRTKFQRAGHRNSDSAAPTNTNASAPVARLG